MRIFVTGATGFIGSALVPELIQAGHSVLGLTRSEAGAAALRAAGAEVQRGNVEDPGSLREGTAKADGVIHLAYNSDLTQFQKATEDDRKAIEAIGEVLVGSNRPFLITSGAAVAMSVDGKPVTEESPLAPWNPRAASETAMKALTERGVVTSVVRLSQVHNTHKQGIVTPAVQVARASFSFIRASGVVVVDDVAGEAVERGERGDRRKVGDHIGIGPHRFHRCEVAPLRVDDYLALILGDDEASRNPTIEPLDGPFSIAAQEIDELWLILRLNGQDV